MDKLEKLLFNVESKSGLLYDDMVKLLRETKITEPQYSALARHKHEVANLFTFMCRVTRDNLFELKHNEDIKDE